jgi:hypothetical protein
VPGFAAGIDLVRVGRSREPAPKPFLPPLYRRLAAVTDAGGMNRYLALAFVALLLPASALGGSASGGTWKRLPGAPISPEWGARTSVWTGKQMLVFGRAQLTALDARGNPYATGAVNVAAAYDPQAKSWRKLSPPTKASGFMGLSSVWTGKEMLVWGQGTRLAYNPATGKWRQLPGSSLLRIHDGFQAVVWTGREMLGWGGGCCGDAFSDGVAYSPATNSWHALPKAPLPGSQHPIGVWTGKEYLVLAGAHGAAYSPRRNSWRRIATPPVRSDDSTAVWSGHDVFVVSASRTVASYDPAKDRWQKLPTVPVARVGQVVAWDGARLLVWGGKRGGASLTTNAKSWTPFARGPLTSRLQATAVWTGTSLIVWGGVPTKTWGRYDEAGGVFTPPALGCGDDWMPENLAATQSVKDRLRVAYLAAHPAAHVGGPALGHTYYGMYSGTSYAVAMFGSAPTIFRTDGRGRWHVRAETHGSVCATVVPVELLEVWSLKHGSGSCYVLPR